jgi:AbrB family looped-hinge helix DNA binding protein
MFHGMQFYGVGTVGEKGQIVIPAKARAEQKIKSGDQFIFFAHGPVIHFVRTDELDQILDRMTQKFGQKVSRIRAKINRKLKK